MLISTKKDRSAINIISDLELLLSEVVDKLDIKVNGLRSFTVVDNTRKYSNWNKIESVDTSNYVRFERYEVLVANKVNIPLPWKGYDTNLDLDVKVFLEGKLLTPSRDYVIRTEADASQVVAGYVIDFGPYLINMNQPLLNGNVTVTRFTTKLPINVSAIDILVNRYDKSISGTGQQNFTIPWGSITENDLSIEVYVDGILFREDLAGEPGSSTYKLYSTYIYFNKTVNGTISIIRRHKVAQ